MASRTPAPSSSRRSTAQQHDGSGPMMIGPFQRQDEIGKGSFALVYRGVHVKYRTLVAIKSVQLSKLNKKLKENLLSEIKILQSLQHPHIVALFQCQESTSQMHLVMEYCELSDLSQFIKKRASLGDHEATRAMIKKYPNPRVGGINEVIARHFLQQISSALEFLREKNYVHRDIKPQNLLLVPSPRYYAKNKPPMMPFTTNENSLVPAAGIESLPMLKVADFGFARVLPTTSLAETLCGSPLYMAPEILRYEKYDAKADLWSVGTVLHEMMVGKPPFRAQNHVELLRKIQSQEDEIRFPEGAEISRPVKRLIRKLLKQAPTERISYEDFFNDPVVTEPIPGLVGDDAPQEPEPKASGEIRSVEKRDSGARPAQGIIRAELQAAHGQSVRDRSSQSSTPPSRPISRHSSGAHAAAKPASSPDDRFVDAPSPTNERRPSLLGERRPSLLRDKRPSITSHATAPPRQSTAQDRTPPSTAQPIERRANRQSPSPSSSMLKEHLNRERIPQRVDERAQREARDRAAQDIAFERDYVLVEKRAVEVNAFADELAASPRLHVPQRDRPTSPQHGAMVRRSTQQGPPTSTTGASAPSRTLALAAGRPRPDPIHQRTGSYERRYGSIPGSATSAISKALNMANFRLFGVGMSPPSGRGLSPPQGYQAFPTYPTAQGGQLLIGDSKSASSKDEDSKVVTYVEELATRSDVVWGFAEIKYQLLLPATPANDQALGINQSLLPAETSEDPDDSGLTHRAIIDVAEEALVLYVKVLAILAQAIDVAGSWWGQKTGGEIIEQSSSPRSHPQRPANAAVGVRMNHVVQWARTRFNECLEKSEFVGAKLVEAQRRLPLSDPAHPSNHPSASGSATSGASVGTSAENITLTTGVTAEKLMYDRAVDMSRTAAVNELVGEDLSGCEISYVTAIRMLEAILEGDSTLSRKSSGSRRPSKTEAETGSTLEWDDRQMLIKIIDQCKARLKSLKKKMEIQKTSKRTSLTALPSSNTGSRSSPSRSPTPVTSQTPPK